MKAIFRTLAGRCPALSRPLLPETASRVLFFILPLLLYLAPRAAAWWLPVVAAAQLWLAWDERVLRTPRDLLGAVAWVPLLVVMAGSASWAIDPAAALFLAARLVVLMILGALLVIATRRLAPVLLLPMLVALAWGLLVAGILVVVDLAAGAHLVHLLHHRATLAPAADAYSPGGVFQGVVAVPVLIALWRTGRRRLALAQMLAGALAVFVGVQVAAKLALIVGLVAGAVVLVLPLARWGWLALLAALTVSLPLLLPIALPESETCWLAAHKPSALHRVLIWNWVDARIRERPAIGWGLDASRRMPGGHERLVVRGCGEPPDDPPWINNEILPLHPHNAALQVWLELGALGVAAALGALVLSIGAEFRLHSSPRSAPAAAALVSATAVALISFGIWQEWWIAALWLASAIAVAAARASIGPTSIAFVRPAPR